MKKYTEKDLILFGNYMMSKKRKDIYKERPSKGMESLNERLARVSDGDLSFLRAMINKK